MGSVMRLEGCCYTKLLKMFSASLGTATDFAVPGDHEYGVAVDVKQGLVIILCRLMMNTKYAVKNVLGAAISSFLLTTPAAASSILLLPSRLYYQFQSSKHTCLNVAAGSAAQADDRHGAGD